MLQDPEGLLAEGERRHRERLARVTTLHQLESGRSMRHTVAIILRRVAQLIDSGYIEPRPDPDRPRPAS